MVFVSNEENPPLYTMIRQKIYTSTIFGETLTATKQLLKNPDGIICWQDSDNGLHWYYANPRTQSLDPITMRLEFRLENATQLEAFVKSMVKMEPWTARRSSDQEHELFSALFINALTNEPITVVRQGIHYQQDGIAYTDTHYDFNRLENAYLKFIELYNHNPSDCHEFWQAVLSRVQKEVMWVVQTYCDRNYMFYPTPDNFKITPLTRSFKVFDPINQEYKSLFDVRSGNFSEDFGINSGFGLCKDEGEGLSGYPSPSMRSAITLDYGTAAARRDFFAINRLIDTAIQLIEAPIDEFSAYFESRQGPDL